MVGIMAYWTGDLTTHGFRASFPAKVLWRFGPALCRKRSRNDCLVHINVSDGRDADAWRLDNVDGMDADARTDVARRYGRVPRYVDGDDGGNDAAVSDPDAVALSPGS